MRTDLDALRPDGERMAADLDTLSSFSESAEPGWTRRVFSEAYLSSRRWVAEVMTRAGLETHVDGAGNIVGRLPGENSSATPLVIGSHTDTDTVRGGGRFDGIVGVLGAIETARRLKETGTRLPRDLIVIDFLGEEANEFGVSCLGSRAIAGVLTAQHLDRVNPEGTTLGSALRDFGVEPGRALGQAWRPGSVHGYLELHVEQGPLLERAGMPIGVVTAIAGIERLLATFTGRADHAGTMPMDERRDALSAAAEAVLTIEREACGAPIHGVSTTGMIEAFPGAMNIVPSRTSLWAEVRSVDASWLSGTKRRLVEDIGRQASRRGVDSVLQWLNDQPPVESQQAVRDHIASASDALGHRWKAIPSGAGHDAAHMAGLGPMGMIFIPSAGGRSHVPEEFTPAGDIVDGVHVLTATVSAMAGEPSVEND